MRTVKDALAEGFDQIVVYWSEPTRHGTERRNLSDVSIETEIESYARQFSSSHKTTTGVSLSRPRNGVTAPMDHEEVFIWGKRSS